MAFYRPEGYFGPVCDPIGVVTIGSDPVIIDDQVAEDEFKPCAGFPEIPPNPSWLAMPTQTNVLCREKNGATEYKFVSDRPELYEYNEALNERIAKVFAADVEPFVPPPAFDASRYCQEFFGDTKIAPDVFQGKTRYYKLRSFPRTFSVSNDMWDDEMNLEAAWLSQGVCSYEDKTIAAQNAPSFEGTLVIDNTGTHTLRYRFSKQGEVWLNYGDEDQQQLLSVLETRSSYDNSQFETKFVNLDAGEYRIYFVLENPTVGSYKKEWDNSPIAAALQVYEGTYSSTTTTGIPTEIGMSTASNDGVTYTTVWSQAWVPDLSDQSGVFAIADANTEYTINFSNNGMVGTAKVRPVVKHVYNSSTGNYDYFITSEWTVNSITSYGSGFAVDDTFSISYTGSVGGTATANVKVFAAQNVTTGTGTKIWSTSQNLVGFDTSFTPFN